MSEKREFSKITQQELLIEYFVNHPNKEIHHPEVVDWALKEYTKRTGEVFRDPDRGIRLLYQKGLLIKIAKGVYKYDPEYLAEDKTVNDFTEEQKEVIKKTGNYKCAICGLGPDNNMEIQVDHIIPKELGGTNDISNGQVLCSKHNFLKKTFKQTETGKRFFINLLASLINQTDKNADELKAFAIDVLQVYEKHNINGQIEITDDEIKSLLKK